MSNVFVQGMLHSCTPKAEIRKTVYGGGDPLFIQVGCETAYIWDNTVSSYSLCFFSLLLIYKLTYGQSIHEMSVMLLPTGLD